MQKDCLRFTPFKMRFLSVVVLCCSLAQNLAALDRNQKFTGTQPAWISRDGELMVQTETKGSNLVRDINGVPYSEILNNLEAGPEVFEGRSSSSNIQRESAQTNALVPSPIQPNGSDIFLHDAFEPNLEYPSEKFNNSRVNVSTGCFFKEDVTAYLVCNDTSITTLPAQLPDQLLVFELNTTQVGSIPVNAFENMTVLFMKLDANIISQISQGAFQGLRGLLYLSLERNRISSLDFLIFKELSSLAVLSLRDNRINATETGWTITCNDTALPSLTYLDLGGNPLGALNQYVFWSLRDTRVEELNLQSCNLNYIHPDALRPLQQLIHVDFFNNPGLLTLSVSPYLSPMRQIGLASLQLEAVPFRFLEKLATSLVGINLSGNYFLKLSKESLPELPFLSTLVLENCGIYSIQESTFEKLIRLKYLYLGRNKLREMPSNVFPPSVSLLSLRQNPDNVIGSQFSLGSYRFRDATNLTWLDLESTSINSIESHAFYGMEKLRVLQIRRGGLTRIEPMAFEGLGSLLFLDLGHNSGFEILQSDTFTGLKQLKFLFLDNCNFNFPEAVKPTNATLHLPFSGLANIEQIYLNNNNIRRFHPELIANLTSLTILDLSSNRITEWVPSTTRNMASRAALDLSSNKISYLQNGTFAEFSRLAAVDLSDNNFILDCQLQDLLLLVNTTNVTIRHWENPHAYTCVDVKTQQVRPIQTLSEEDLSCDSLESDHPNSANKLPIYVSASAGILIFIVALVSYYNRRYIRHSWFMKQTQVRRYKSSESQSNDYDYDAFVSFSEQDRNWVYSNLVPQLEATNSGWSRKIRFDSEKRLEGSQDNSTVPLRLCLHDRDFVAGQRITENIIDTISRSRKVLIVLSRNYLRSKWCQYELHLAQHRLLEEHRGDLVLILLENIPVSEQSRNVRYLMKTRTYLAWHNDIEGQQLFFRRLASVLRKVDPPEHSYA